MKQLTEEELTPYVIFLSSIIGLGILNWYILPFFKVVDSKFFIDYGDQIYLIANAVNGILIFCSIISIAERFSRYLTRKRLLVSMIVLTAIVLLFLDHALKTERIVIYDGGPGIFSPAN